MRGKMQTWQDWTLQKQHDERHAQEERPASTQERAYKAFVTWASDPNGRIL